MRIKDTKVCIIGLGVVGLSTAVYVKEKGLEVIGYDIDVKAIEKSRKNGITAYKKWEDVGECDIYIICVTTSLNKNKPNLSSVYNVISKINKTSMDNTLISIESTVPMGACRALFRNTLKNRGMLIHVPHRYWSGDTINHGVKQHRVIGAINDRSMNAGQSFYSGILEIPLYKTSTIETAEMCKITENTDRFLKIAFAEELKMMCDNAGVDFEDLRNACNTKWNMEILEPREGIGGTCLPKYIVYLSLLGKNGISQAAIKADKRYKSWLSDRNLSKHKKNSPYVSSKT
ncbi:MAG: NAD(P)-binding domain-containing protein [Thermoplasmata archaeon]